MEELKVYQDDLFFSSFTTLLTITYSLCYLHHKKKKAPHLNNKYILQCVSIPKFRIHALKIRALQHSQFKRVHVLVVV